MMSAWPVEEKVIKEVYEKSMWTPKETTELLVRRVTRALLKGDQVARY